MNIISKTVRLVLVLSIALLTMNGFAQMKEENRKITDMSGRNVIIPAKVNRIISLSNNTSVYIYTLAPDKLIGWSFNQKPAAAKFMDAKYFNLPVLGTSTEKTSSYENILKLRPDIVICSNEDEVYAADDIQKQLGIPVLMVDTALESTPEVYRFLGECLGEQTRAKQLATYSRNVLNRIRKLLRKLPDDKRLRVYYAEGSGLQTDVAGNVHTEALDFVKGKNVADISETHVGSMIGVSMEQVLAWNPDVIIIGISRQGDFYNDVFHDVNWANIKAVKEKKVYRMPALPFNWFDRPPSPARILAVEWLANLLYPQYVKLDLSHEVKAFFVLFYHYQLNDQEVQELLKDAVPR
ncbi:MAG TPA: ABC transporter substrate-binding protein [Firmicutes bacterium]|jgi:iron complex transport system substrate-binding protein|nr:ABC transporter substrate-binding protein [Bacillota bacterium]